VFGTLSAFSVTMVLLPVLYRIYANVSERLVSVQVAPKPEVDTRAAG
jgi:hypothetical protein